MTNENKELRREYHKKYHKEWYQRNKEKRSQQIKEYGIAHREDSVRRTQKYVQKNKENVYAYGRSYNKTVNGGYRTYKSNALKRLKEFTLTPEEFTAIVSMPCYYCGETSLRRDIDRVENAKGYLKENSVACCKLCNYMKKNYSVDDFLNHIKKIANFNAK